MTRKGSVVVEFKLKFKGKLKTEEALAPLKEGIKDGRMGSLRVDPESLRVKNGREGNTFCLFYFVVVVVFISHGLKKKQRIK